jgi:OPT family oligopeptide transporter
MLLGCVIGWGVLSPVSYYAGWAPGPVSDWKTGSKGWILWISLGVMIAESLVSMAILLFKQLWVMFFKRPEPCLDEAVSESLLDEDENTEGWDGELENEIEDNGVVKEERDLGKEHQVPHSVTIIGLLASIGLCLGTVAIVFGTDVIPIYMTLLAVVVAMFLSILGVRALGESDLNPVSGIGKISQIIFAAVMPHAIVPNLIAGGIAEAGAQQAGDLMQDLKTGHLIGASPKAQFYGQLLGSLVSSFVSTGAYLLYSSVYEIPGTEFPAPTAQVWLDMSRLVNGHPLPPHVTEFVIGFSVLFGVLVLLKETGPRNSWRQYIPQGIAFAIGIYNPPSFTLARVIGGFISYFWDQYCDSPSSNSAFDRWCKPYKTIGRVFIIIVASGFVLGEGTFAIVNMILHSLHVVHY